MKRIKILFFLLCALVLVKAPVYSDSDCNSKGELSYSCGPFVSVGDLLSVGAYFGPNNILNAFVGVQGALTQNFTGFPQTKRISNKFTSFVAGANYFVPIAKNCMGNRFFFLTDVHWTQNFGKVNGLGKYATNWQISLFNGFQYRFSSVVYLSVSTEMLSYNKINYKNPNVGPGNSNNTNSQWSWNIVGTSSQITLHFMF